jgi:hypothetical protein
MRLSLSAHWRSALILAVAVAERLSTRSRMPEAQDEYDGYVQHISSMIALKKSVDEISDYLRWAETDNMGLVADQRKARLIAAKLATLSE